MMARDNTHSRVVAWLKVALPLMALALLSTLFLVSRRIMPEDALPYAEVDIEQLAREQRLGAPEYSGLTDDGAAINITARILRPDLGRSAVPGGTGADAEGLTARLQAANGTVTDLVSDAGSFDPEAQRMALSGNVHLRTSDGLAVATEELQGTLDRTELVAPGAVDAQMPMGALTAGGMRITGARSGYLAVFNDGVKLVYHPQQDAGTAPPRPTGEQAAPPPEE